MTLVLDESEAKALQWLMQLQKDHGEEGIQRLMSNSTSVITSATEKFVSAGRAQSQPLTPVEAEVCLSY